MTEDELRNIFVGKVAEDDTNYAVNLLNTTINEYPEYTYLHAAVFLGWGHIVEILINSGMDVNEGNGFVTPLHLALNAMFHSSTAADQDEYYLMINLLLDEGADITALDANGDSVIGLAEYLFGDEGVININQNHLFSGSENDTSVNASSSELNFVNLQIPFYTDMNPSALCGTEACAADY